MYLRQPRKSEAKSLQPFAKEFQRFIHVRLHRTQGDAHHVGNVFVLHVVQVAQLEYFLAFIGQLVDGAMKLRTQLLVLYPADYVRMAGLVIV